MHPHAFAIVLLLLGCTGGSDNRRSDQGRGTETCRIWQDAICDHFADECEYVDRGVCDRQYQSVTCRSDDIADRCTDMLRSASCGEARSDCLIEGVANPEPAREACDSLIETFCERSLVCGVSVSKERCQSSSSMLAQCGKAVGYQLNYETCLEEIPNIACDVLVFPEQCSDVFVKQR